VDENQAIMLVTRLVCRFRHLDASQVSPDADLARTLGFDSLDAAELLAAIHKETGRELEIGSLEQLRTVADIARCMAGTAPAGSAAAERGAAL
jgi:acyl carrier protein